MSRIKSNQISASIPEINIISPDSSKFESSIGSWVTYADAAATQPVDGTGGSASITLSRTTVTSEVLNGSASLKLAKGATNRQGDGASLDITVPNYLKGQPCKISFSAKGSANFDFGSAFDSSDPSDVTVYLYDVTNSKLIQPYPYTIMTNMGYEGTFQIPSDCSNLRLILHVTTTNAAAYDLFIDEVQISKADNVTVAVISDWQTFTPTGSWVTNTTYTGRYRRIGENMECQVFVATSGAPTAVALTVNLPTGLLIDESKLAQGSTLYATYFSSVTVGDSSSSLYGPGEVTPQNTTSVFLRTSNAGGTYAQPSSISNTVPITFGAGDSVTAHFTVPIVGWTSGQTTAASANLNTPVIFKAYKSGGAVTAATTIASWTSIVQDTTNSFNSTTGEYTVKVPGDYAILARLSYTAASNELFDIFLNGTLHSEIGMGNTSANAAGIGLIPNLKVGDILTLRTKNGKTLVASTGEANYWTMYKIDTPGRVYSTRIAYIKDVKAANTAGQSIAAGSFVTQNLNTIEGDSSFVSVASNQFTLQPGTYQIYATIPLGGSASNSGSFKQRLRNITAGTTSIVGSTSNLAGSATPTITGIIMGVVSISVASTFEIQTRRELNTGNVPASNLGEVEVYTQVKIEKVL